MTEILEEIKKMSREEQLELAEQIYALGDETQLTVHEEELLKSRAQEAKRNGFPGRPAEDVLADLERG